MKKLSKNTEHSMIVRIITGLVLGLVLGPAGIFGGWYLLAVSFVLVFFAAYEILALPGKKHYSKFIWVWTYVWMYAMIYWIFFKDDNIRNELFAGNFFSLNQIHISIFSLIIYLIGLFCFSFLYETFRLDDVFYLFTMVFLVSLGFYSIMYLRYYPTAFLDKTDPVDITLTYNWSISSSMLLWFCLFGVWCSDIGAYFVGVLFGKHPMNPRVSPHKTWEGFFGGVALSMIFTLSFSAISWYCFKTPLIKTGGEAPLDGLSFESQSGWGWGYILLLSIIIPIMDNIGGFIFSAVKRHFNVKDWGFILPGHGGIIDRFDSIFVTCSVVAILISFITNGWTFLQH